MECWERAAGPVQGQREPILLVQDMCSAAAMDERWAAGVRRGAARLGTGSGCYTDWAGTGREAGCIG